MADRIRVLQPYHTPYDPLATFAVYIMASQKYGTLYTGHTSDLIRRVYEHRNKLLPGFTADYDVTMLVYFEQHRDKWDCITREKRLKKWNRDWKIRLIEENNPHWIDLYPGLL